MAKHPSRSVPTSPRKVDPEQASHVRLMTERLRSYKEQLGDLDVERAMLDVKRGQILGEIQREANERGKLLDTLRKDANVPGDGGWFYDFASGEFRPPGQS